MAYSAVPTVATGDLWTAANHNQYIKDNFTALYSRTVSFFVQANISNSITPGFGPNGVVLADSADRFADGFFSVPANFVSGLTATPIILPTNTGNIYWAHFGAYGAVGEAYNNHTNTKSMGATAVTGSVLNALTTLSLSSAAVGDYVSLEVERDATNVLDTSTGSISIMGWLISYTAGG